MQKSSLFLCFLIYLTVRGISTITVRPARPRSSAFASCGQAVAYGLVGFGKIERLGSVEIDHKLEPGRLFHRKLGWLCAVEESVPTLGRASTSFGRRLKTWIAGTKAGP
jgi:hypothetical protein